jgi:hypothetical protein
MAKPSRQIFEGRRIGRPHVTTACQSSPFANAKGAPEGPTLTSYLVADSSAPTRPIARLDALPERASICLLNAPISHRELLSFVTNSSSERPRPANMPVLSKIKNVTRRATSAFVEGCARLAEVHPFAWKVAWEAVHQLPFLLPHDKSYNAFRHFIAKQPNGLFLDVGANDGKHPVWTAGVPGCAWSANHPCERQASPVNGTAAMIFFR